MNYVTEIARVIEFQTLNKIVNLVENRLHTERSGLETGKFGIQLPHLFINLAEK
jgi:hypothetical protein